MTVSRATAYASFWQEFGEPGTHLFVAASPDELKRLEREWQAERSIVTEVATVVRVPPFGWLRIEDGPVDVSAFPLLSVSPPPDA